MKDKSVFALDEFKPLRWQFDQQASRYSLFERYYRGTMYETSVFRVAHKLYAGIKALFLPLSRSVDLDVALVPGDWLLREESQALQPAVDQVLKWSRWLTDGPLYVQWGASLGDVVLKVVDVTDLRQVLIEPLTPSEVVLQATGRYNPTPRLALVVRQERDENGDLHEYAEAVDAERIRTYRDGEPFGYDGRDPEYANDLGFVPFVKVQHINEGSTFGAPTFDKTIPLLNAVNELASYLADMIGRHAEPQWAVSGAEPASMTKSGDNVWFLPEGAEVSAILATIDIKGVLEFIQEVKTEMKAGLVELAFDDIRDKNRIATASIELQLAELVAKLKRVRRNYDAGLAEALRMAGLAAATMGLGDVAPLAAGVELDDKRPVLPQLPRDVLEVELLELQIEQVRELTAGEEGFGSGAGMLESTRRRWRRMTGAPLSGGGVTAGVAATEQ